MGSGEKSSVISTHIPLEGRSFYPLAYSFNVFFVFSFTLFENSVHVHVCVCVHTFR